MTILLSCSACSRTFQISDSMHGKLGQCPCGQLLGKFVDDEEPHSDDQERSYDVITVAIAHQLVEGYVAYEASEDGEVDTAYEWHDLYRFRVLEDDAAAVLASCKGNLNLSGLESLSLAAATLLSDQPWEGSEESWHTVDLDISGLSTIDLDVLEVLAARFTGMPDYMTAGDLTLDGLETITLEQSHLLSSCGGSLCLDGLTEISTDAAVALGSFSGDELSLDGLTTLTGEIARSLLIKGEGDDKDISLDGLQEISGDAASAWVEFLDEGNGIWLPELKELPVDVATAFAQVTGSISLGVKEISLEVARILSTHEQGCLSLSGLENPDDEILIELSSHQGSGLAIEGLHQISDVVAEHLGRHKGDLTLSGLKTISEDAATSLSKHVGNLGLGYDWEESLSKEIQNILKKHPSLFEVSEDGTPGVIPAQMLSDLQELNIREFIATYDGSGDDGEAEFQVTGTDGELLASGYYYGDDLGKAVFETLGESVATLDRCIEVCNAAESLIWNVLPDGFEIETGSYGTVQIDAESGEITVDHTWR